MSSGMGTANESSDSESTMESSTQRQYSLTCVSSSSPVALDNTGDLLTWLQGDSLVSRSASQESKQGPTMSAICGPPRSESFARYDRNTASWRTSGDYLPTMEGDILGEYSDSFPKQGMMRSGVCYPLAIAVRRIEGTGSGLWPTPSGTSSNSHVIGQLGDWGGSSNPWRGTELAKVRCASFEEWMMGMVIGWSGQTPLEMHKYQSWRRAHGLD
jgi:hypothetical protein